MAIRKKHGGSLRIKSFLYLIFDNVYLYNYYYKKVAISTRYVSFRNLLIYKYLQQLQYIFCYLISILFTYIFISEIFFESITNVVIAVKIHQESSETHKLYFYFKQVITENAVQYQLIVSLVGSVFESCSRLIFVIYH